MTPDYKLNIPALRRGLAATALVGALAGCKHESAEETFRYDMTDTTDVDVAVTSASGPIANALVYVREEDGGPPVFQGATDVDGHIRGKLTAAGSVERVNVVVVHAGFHGPWNAAASRESYGTFAPASWTTQNAHALSNLVLTLEAEQ